MGFTPQRKQYRLKFQDADLAGLEVLMHSASLGDILQLQSTDPKNTSPEDLQRMLGILSRAMVEWNMEDASGDPVPTTVRGLETQEVGLIMAILSAWTEAITGVTPPLPGGSPSGETFQEVSLPMEIVSPNL